MLKEVDIYGRVLHFNVDGCAETVSTTFGGLMTILFVVMMSGYSFMQFQKMITKDETIFISSIQTLDIEVEHRDNDGHSHNRNPEAHSGPVNLSKFEDTFGMIVGTTNKDVDLIDNPYI
jgi:hypothetical protein